MAPIQENGQEFQCERVRGVGGYSNFKGNTLLGIINRVSQ